MREEKTFLSEEIKNHIGQATGFVLISYNKLSANKISSFRRDVRKMKGGVEFVKKRILCKACSDLGLSLSVDSLPGHIGLIFSKDDPLEMIKHAFKFKDENGDLVSIVGGNFEGKLLTDKETERLSKLPGKDQMRAELLSVLEAPMSNLLGTFDALISSVVCCLDNKVKQAEEQK